MTSPASASSSPAAASSSAFDLLAEPVRKWVYDQGWQTLRDAQEAAIPMLLEGAADVIIAAATAAGKTEAAFLPICSRLAADPAPGPGVRVLYVAPLKALINDQYQRLAGLCGRLDIPVHRWHGDVPASRKSAVLKKPGGILLITPESLEALFVTRGAGVGLSARGPAVHRGRRTARVPRHRAWRPAAQPDAPGGTLAKAPGSPGRAVGNPRRHEPRR